MSNYLLFLFFFSFIVFLFFILSVFSIFFLNVRHFNTILRSSLAFHEVISSFTNLFSCSLSLSAFHIKSLRSYHVSVFLSLTCHLPTFLILIFFLSLSCQLFIFPLSLSLALFVSPVVINVFQMTKNEIKLSPYTDKRLLLLSPQNSERSYASPVPFPKFSPAENKLSYS